MLSNYKEGHVEGSWHRVDSTHFVDDCDDLTQVHDNNNSDNNNNNNNEYYPDNYEDNNKDNNNKNNKDNNTLKKYVHR